MSTAQAAASQPPDPLELVRRFGEAFCEDRVEAFEALLAIDCVDANPVPLQPPGRDGVVFKVALFHARYPGFVTRFTAIDSVGDAVVARWTTAFPNGELTRWRGRFTFDQGRISAFETIHVG